MAYGTRESFVTISPQSDFSLANLPYGIFSTRSEPTPRVGVAIGELVLDLPKLSCFTRPQAAAFQNDELNGFTKLGPQVWHDTRETLQRILSKSEGYLRDNRTLQNRLLLPQKDAQMHLPLRVGNFTDFSSSRKHAENDRIMFTDKNERILANWDYIPVAYHSRASSIVVSGQNVIRPTGQYLPSATLANDNECRPVFEPSQKVDFEMEFGAVIGTGNELGHPIKVHDADQHVFGFALLNDWSARDIQSWEWQPLGPFLCKSFCTTISPWIVTAAALEPFLCEPIDHQVPEPLPYLKGRSLTTYDVNLTASLTTTKSRNPVLLSQSNFKYMYWTLAQQIAHQTSNGCNLLAGDLIGSGTVSGPTRESSGSLSELSARGTKPIDIGTGETRAFLQDGDEVILHGWCLKDGLRVGFGHCTGVVCPAMDYFKST